MQPGGLPGSAAQHAVDAVAAGERNSGWGAAGAALPLHVPRAPARPPRSAVWPEEDGDQDLPRGRLGSLRHRRYRRRAPLPPRPRALARAWGETRSGTELRAVGHVVWKKPGGLWGGSGAAGCAVTEASLPTRAPPSPGGGSAAQRGHLPALGERGLGRMGPVVVLLPGL